MLHLLQEEALVCKVMFKQLAINSDKAVAVLSAELLELHISIRKSQYYFIFTCFIILGQKWGKSKEIMERLECECNHPHPQMH